MYKCKLCEDMTAQRSGWLCRPCWWKERNKPTTEMDWNDRLRLINMVIEFLDTREERDFTIESLIRNGGKKWFEILGTSAGNSVCIINRYGCGVLEKQFAGHSKKHALKEDKLGRPINRYEIWE